MNEKINTIVISKCDFERVLNQTKSIEYTHCIHISGFLIF